MEYVTVIKYATLVFPLVAFLFTIPFILIEYHKYGSISPLKSIITYLFIYYLLCAYFLVILPLPKISEVAKMTSPRLQLIPFDFLLDFIKHTSLRINDLSTYLPAIKESYFYVPLFNVFLTIPFGIFLRYYFKCDKKRVILYTFLLSLFFELTQLSGLYFIYPRGYRLCDVDDLIQNTFGGLLGYYIAKPILTLVPKIDEINESARKRGKTVSGLRRTVCYLLDLLILMTIELLIIILSGDHFYLSIIIAIIYYFLIPLLLGTATLGQKFLKIEVRDDQNKRNYFRTFLRRIIAVSIYILTPFFVCSMMMHQPDNIIRELIGLMIIGILFLMYAGTGLKYLFTNKEMLYEKLSKTKLISTIR